MPATKKIVKKLALNRETVRGLGVNTALRTGIAPGGYHTQAKGCYIPGQSAGMSSRTIAASGDNFSFADSIVKTDSDDGGGLVSLTMPRHF